MKKSRPPLVLATSPMGLVGWLVGWLGGCTEGCWDWNVMPSIEIDCDTTVGGKNVVACQPVLPVTLSV